MTLNAWKHSQNQTRLMVKNLFHKRQDAIMHCFNQQLYRDKRGLNFCVKKHTKRKNSATQTQLPVSSDTSAFFSEMVLFFKNRPSKIWRRERDSNPRWVAPHLISSQAQSTTLSSLRTDSFIGCDYRIFGKLKQQDLKQKSQYVFSRYSQRFVKLPKNIDRSPTIYPIHTTHQHSI